MSFLPKDWTKFGEIFRNEEHSIYICTLCRDKAHKFSHNFVFYDVISLVHHIEYKHDDRMSERMKFEEYLKKHNDGGMHNQNLINSKLRKLHNDEMSGKKKKNADCDRENADWNAELIKKLKIKQEWLSVYDDSVTNMLLQEKPIPGRKPNYSCPYCSDVFHTNLELLTHLNVHKGSEKQNEKTTMTSADASRPYKCNECFQNFSAPWQLKRHENIHANPDAPKNMHLARPYQCQRCGKRTSSEKSLILHNRRFHSDEDVLETAKCNVCNKLILEVNMRQHKLVHSNKRSFKCELCARTYRQRQSLTWHIKNKHIQKAVKIEAASQSTEVKDIERPTLENTDEVPNATDAESTFPDLLPYMASQNEEKVVDENEI